MVFPLFHGSVDDPLACRIGARAHVVLFGIVFALMVWWKPNGPWLGEEAKVRDVYLDGFTLLETGVESMDPEKRGVGVAGECPHCQVAGGRHLSCRLTFILQVAAG